MPDVVSSILLSWNERGELQHRISGGYAAPQENILLVLAPSLPMVLSHQLGALKPSYGLTLCDSVLNILETGNHSLIPVNRALENARIDFQQTHAGMNLTFHPQSRPSAVESDIEEAVPQLLCNYTCYVLDRLSGEARLSVMAYVLSVVNWYLELVEREISRGRVGPRRDRWSLRFTRHMAECSRDIADNFTVEEWEPTGSDTPPGGMAGGIERGVVEIRARHRLVSERMGIIEDKAGTEITEHIVEAFYAVGTVGGLETPKPFEPGSKDIYREGSKRAAELYGQGKEHLRLADARIRELQKTWRDKRKPLRQLRSAVAELVAMIGTYERLNIALSLDTPYPTPQEQRRLVMEGRRHAHKSDSLLAKALSALGWTLEIEREDGRKQIYP